MERVFTDNHPAGYPLGEFDARLWADYFTELFDGALIRRMDNHVITGDDLNELMHTWFANAIMNGYDICNNEQDNARI